MSNIPGVKIVVEVINGVLHIFKPHYGLEIIDAEQARVNYAFTSASSKGNIISLKDAVKQFNNKPPQHVKIELKEVLQMYRNL